VLANRHARPGHQAPNGLICVTKVLLLGWSAVNQIGGYSRGCRGAQGGVIRAVPMRP
jgi:hypothetical protein